MPPPPVGEGTPVGEGRGGGAILNESGALIGMGSARGVYEN